MTRNQLLGGGVVVTSMATMAMACALAACGPLAGPAGGGGDMASASNDMATGSGGSGGSGGGDMATPISTMLPFVLDTAFVSSGYMGDGNMAGPITMVPSKMGDSTDCNGKRGSTTALGACHVVTYMPPATAGMGWGGVYWQYPANNWGTKPGYAMPSGAKKVSFSAMGSKG